MRATWLALLLVLAACQLGKEPPAQAGQPCPAWVHDQYVVKGPDGRLYPTWHPQVDPSGCYFDHEHGDDPRSSQANPSLPPFGYVGAVAGVEEAHAGFKVFVVNRGTLNDEGRDAKTSSRIVAHMGTGGPKRFTERHHSLIFDLVAPDGHEVHVQGMADTALAGSICERDQRLADADPANDIGRTVVIVKGQGCDLGSLYEIWQFRLRLGGRVEVLASTAAFDPITVMDPRDRSRKVYTVEAYPEAEEVHGCDREAYHGPVYWYNRAGPVEFFTDAYGNAGGPLRQWVSRHDDIGIPMSPDQNQFKLHRSHCAPGLGQVN